MQVNSQNSIPQPVTNSFNDYFYIRQQVENSGILNTPTDTGEGGFVNAYARWRWFWDGRNTNAGKVSSNNMQALGDMSEYLSLLFRFSNASSQTNLRYNSNVIVANDFQWQNINNSESVFNSYGNQTGGRIDVIKANPTNHNEVYAGTPTSGLWRCKNISQTQPVWENVTENIGISYLGVMGLAINPNGKEAVILVGCNTFYNTSLGIGVFYTNDITATPVVWNNISTGMLDLDLANTASIPHYKFLDIYFNDSGLGFYQYYFMTDKALYGIVNGNISKISNVKDELNNFTGGNVLLRSFIYDKSTQGLFYVSALQSTGSNNNLYQPKLFALNLSGQPTITDLTTILPNIKTSVEDQGYNRPIIFSHGQNGIYALYLKGNNNRNIVNLTMQQASAYDISATSAVFYVSSVDQNIFYTESESRQIQKNIGNTNLGYGYFDNHPDLRAFDMVVDNGGVDDVILLGNDGGVMLSNSSGGVQSAKPILQQKNGQGLATSMLYKVDQTGNGESVLSVAAHDNGIFKKQGNNNWQLSIIGDGFNVFTMEHYPNVVYTQYGGRAYSNSIKPSLPLYIRSNDPLYTNTICTSLTNGSGILLYDQPIKEVNDILFMAFSDIWMSNDQGTTWQNITRDAQQMSKLSKDDCTPINAIGISSDSHPVVYATTSEIKWDPNNGVDNVFFKGVYDIYTNQYVWQDIGNNINPNGISNKAIIYSPINDITVSYINTNTVWTGMGGVYEDVNSTQSGNVLTAGVLRVVRSDDAGNTWYDYSNGLPPFPVNVLTAVRGTNNGIFAGTDVGVYYTDDDIYPTQGWVRINNGMPSALVTDIDVNYCHKTINVSTFGRSIWQSPLPKKLFIDTEILSNTSWTGVHYLDNNLIIKSGATLTLNSGSTVYMPKNGKIVVERGAQLIVDGATITNGCGEYWAGIELWGDNSKSQLTAGAQGIVVIKNNALIENARDAITTQERDANNNTVWNTFGGIIKASNSTFKNNSRSIEFLSYRNFNPNNPSQTFKNISFIENCLFVWDDNGLMADYVNDPPRSHITMWDVYRVSISSSTFENNISNIPLANSGIGIYSIDAAYYLGKKCTAFNNLSCTSFTVNTFNNLNYGIAAENSNPAKSITVKSTDFNNCLRGIHLKNMDYAELIENNMQVPVASLNQHAYGIYLENCNAYEVENNTINGSSAEYGIYVKNSGIENNEIYRNTLTNTEYGIATEATNGLGGAISNAKGLQFKCNTFSNSPISGNDIFIAGIVHPYQGSCQTATSPANNIFTPASSSFKNIRIDPYMQHLYYYHSTDPGNTYNLSPVPDNPALFTDNPCLYTFTPNDACPNHQQSGVVIGSSALITQINALRQQADSLLNTIDGGNTADLESIAGSNAPAWQIRNQLLAQSPYLSEKVLLTLLNNPNIPAWTIQQILQANAPLTDQVFLATLNRTPALPDYVIRNLALASSPLSTQELLAVINRTPALPSWVINQILTANAPVFDQVLEALINRQPAVAPWAIRNIMQRNVPLSETVWATINNHTPAYPQWVINNIQNSPFVSGNAIEKPQPMSPLLEIYTEVNELQFEAHRLTNELLRNFLHDTTHTLGQDSVIWFLKQYGHQSACCTKKTACAQIAKNDIIAAQSTLDTLATDTANSAFCAYQQAILQLQNSTPNNISGNNNSGIAITLQTFADVPPQNATKEQAGAQAVMEFNRLGTYNETFVSAANNQRTGNTNNHDKNNDVPDGVVQLMNNQYSLEFFKVFPNPARDHIIIEYELSSGNNFEFILYDMFGKEVIREPLHSSSSQQTIKLQSVSAGNYIYKIVRNKEVYEQDKLIIIR